MRKIFVSVSLLFVAILAACDISQVRIIAQEQLSEVLSDLESNYTEEVSYNSVEYSGVYAGIYDTDDDRVFEYLAFYIEYEVEGETSYAIGVHELVHDAEDTTDIEIHDLSIERFDTYDAFIQSRQDIEALYDERYEMFNNAEGEVEVIHSKDSFDLDEIEDYHFE